MLLKSAEATRGKMRLGKSPRWWHGWEVEAILVTSRCPLRHTSIPSAAQGRDRQQGWWCASCHGNAEQCVLVFLKGAPYPSLEGWHRAKRRNPAAGQRPIGVPPPAAAPGWVTAPSHLTIHPPVKSITSFRAGSCSLFFLQGPAEGNLGWFIKK